MEPRTRKPPVPRLHHATKLTPPRQWGNLLTLAAVFRNPILTDYINEHTLRDLFAKTIAFFRLISQPSSALWIDMRILEGLESELWGGSGGNKPSSVDPEGGPQGHHGSSFSSTASGPAPMPGTPMEGTVVTAPFPPIQTHR